MNFTSAWRGEANATKRDKLQAAFRNANAKLKGMFDKFLYNQKVIEELVLVADNVHNKIQIILEQVWNTGQSKSPRQSAATGRTAKAGALKRFVRMPYEDYVTAYSQLHEVIGGQHGRSQPHQQTQADSGGAREINQADRAEAGVRDRLIQP